MRTQRRGVIMLAVIVVLAVAALVAAGLMAASEAEQSGLAAMNDRSQQRANAWSGSQAVAALLAAQRTAILDGEAPEIPDELLLYDADGAEGIARLLPLGPEGERLVPEMAKLSLASVTAEQLAMTGVLPQAAAEAALARRDGSDALEVLVAPESGVPVDAVLGPAAASIADGVRQAQADAGHGSSGGGARAASARSATAGAGAMTRSLAVADVVTPFGAQRAIGSVNGAPATRIAIGDPWSPEAIRAVDAATQTGVAAKLADALGGGAPTDDGDLLRALRLAKVPQAQWSAVLDAVVPGTEAIEAGQVDLSHAPEAVLRALPGIDDALAARLVQERSSLAAPARAQRAWPVLQGVLTAEQFEEIAPALCARSWLWRARIATGTIDRVRGDGQMHGVQVFEVVIDLAEDPPRFASIRDCTLLPIAAGLAAEQARDKDASAQRSDADEAADAAREQTAALDAEAAAAARAKRDLAAGAADEEASDQESTPMSSGEEGEAAQPADEPSSAEPAHQSVPPAAWGSTPWRSLADREAEDRARRSKEWRSLGEQEAADRANRAREWRSLGDDAAQQRKKRDDADRAERARAWKSSGWPTSPVGGAAQSIPAGLPGDALLGRTPAEPGSDASQPAGPGMGTQQTPSANAPTGGLSGRWRRRGG